MYATNYLERNFLNVTKNITFNAPAEVFIGLYLSNPTETGDKGVEVNYGGYERKKIVFSAPATESSGIGIKNMEKISFAKADKNVGTVTYIGISDSKVSGNMLAYGKLTEDLIIDTGETPTLLIGEVVYWITGDLSTAYKTKLLNIFRGQSITGVNPHLALFSGNPDSGGAELSGANYSRVKLTFGNPTVTATGQTEMTTSVDASFNRPSTDWGTWFYTVIMDKDVTGQPIWVQEKNPSKPIKKSYMPEIPAGALKLSIN